MNRRQRVFDITGGRCFYCGCSLDIDYFHIEHMIPKVQGGKNNDNLVPSCQDCNLFKGGLDVEQFREKISSSRKKLQGRMICKFYDVPDNPVVFWFEKEGAQDGNL